MLGCPEREARRLLLELVRRKRARAARWPDLDAEPSEVAGPLARYEAAMRKLDLVDLDDLLALPVMLLAGDAGLAARYRERFGFVAVDEYQDVDELQYRLLRLLTTPDANLCVIGDPDQAIYGFRGADVGFFLRFAQDFPDATTVRLTRNYRSSPAIVAGALQAIAPSTLVAGRELAAVAGADAPARITIHQAASDLAEAEFVVQTVDRLLGGASFLSLDSGRADGGAEHGLSFADVAVLYRTDAQSGPLAEALGRAGMPFQKRSHDRLLDRPAVRALVRALRDPGPADTPARPTGPGRAPATDRSLTARLAAAATATTEGPRPPGRATRPRPLRCSPRWPRVAGTTWTGSWPSWLSVTRSTPGTPGPTGSRCSPCTPPRAWSSRWCSWPAARTGSCRCASARGRRPRRPPRSGGCSSSA